MNTTTQAPRILLSEHTARELAPQLAEIFGPGGYSHVTAADIHAGTADAAMRATDKGGAVFRACGGAECGRTGGVGSHGDAPEQRFVSPLPSRQAG